ncbi:hypothetical protein TH53_12825 [Pedobacter lusitanus]|uniref:Recombinase family protein n=1 Tax=Pedobacter lusitanus TaxID=1503925 RepID=A0A0D0GKU9_9SPHI|nr:recombinase family protein [Pedobacter lusitanus]KIO76800.1 hypothetical protein TH53_12825 [Pedobacter lusitanus]
MKSAYIYVRVSTDEQMRHGYSLIEQEDRLLQHCEINNIQVVGIFREDYSAKDFNRPEWKKLIKTIKKNENKLSENILFLKWDRFSRNIQYAYQMLGILRDLNIQAMAIDQPIDFDIPESIVMLAVYLSIPEAENSRRGKNTSDGMRRARKLGRWPSKAPIGYINMTTSDGKKIIVPKQPEANHIKWSFKQMATGGYSINKVNKMAYLNGFICKRNNFWRLIHNPVYCGFVTLSATNNEDMQLIKGIHEPLISEELFKNVQAMILSKRRERGKKESLKSVFPLRGFLTCPYCNRRLSGSISQGRHAKYRYYHCCTAKCRGRFKAEVLEATYEKQLKNIWISPAAVKLFRLILEDENILTVRKSLLQHRKSILNEVEKEELFLSKVRKLFIDDKIDHEDFTSLKKEQKEKLASINERLDMTDEKIKNNEINSENELAYNDYDILFSYKNQDIEGKRYIINLFRPSSINAITGNLNVLEIDPALLPIILHQKST